MNTQKRRGWLVFFSLALLLPLVVVLSLERRHLVQSAQVRPLAIQPNTYDYLKSLATTVRNLSPKLTEKQELVVECTSDMLLSKRIQQNKMSLVCGKKITISPTSIVIPSIIPTAPTIPNVTNTPVTGGLKSDDPAILGSCSQTTHDKYAVTGPNGKLYRTWHPARDESGCVFAHEHGDDPKTSFAKSTLPAFGYLGELAGDDEPHAGFKVFVANAGTVNDEGRRAIHNTRMVFHMGTGGVKRYVARHHSLMFDMTAGDGSGRYVHVQGMADTGGVGSICANPRQGRTVMVTTGCQTTSNYEIWEGTLKIGDKVTVIGSFAAFDPILAMDPADLSRVVYTKDVVGGGPYYGCNRESYHGPIYWYNRGGATTYQTNVFGAITAGGPLKQEISASSTDFSKQPAYNATNDGLTQFKFRKSQCVQGLGLKN